MQQEIAEIRAGATAPAVSDIAHAPRCAKPCGASHLAASALIFAACLLTGCESATATGVLKSAPADAANPVIICVADFELDVQNIQHEDGILFIRPGPIGRVSRRVSGESQDPEARARKLVELMAQSLVKELKQAGFAATRLSPHARLPASGWLVRGVFTEVQEGNRVRRAMIGFGAGQTDVQVVVGIDNLSQGAPQPLYELETEARSGKAPGAAPTLVLSPYGAAARFVMAGKDLEKNVKQTATQIAAQVKTRVGEGK